MTPVHLVVMKHAPVVMIQRSMHGFDGTFCSSMSRPVVHQTAVLCSMSAVVLQRRGQPDDPCGINALCAIEYRICHSSSFMLLSTTI